MSLKIITFANHKGGVSKTTSTASIGACMARMGKKVLLIDLDGQANLTLYFIPNEDEVQASIFEYDPQSNGAKDYQALTEEIISRNQ